MSFASLGLSEALAGAVEAAGYAQPTPVQQRAVPAVLQGRDLMVAAQTGTGKTAGFALPILERLFPGGHPDREHRHGPKQPRVLVLTPTRELAAQVHDSFKIYARDLPLVSACIFGGVGMNPQVQALAKGVDLLVACPGRLLDLAGQGSVDLSRVEILVLDEADRMLDMGFIHDVKKVLARLPAQRQNLLFSATFSKDIIALATKLLHDPERIEVTPPNTTVERIEQRVFRIPATHKRALLAHLITLGTWEQVLVFTRTKHGANRLAEYLDKHGLPAAAIHGNKSQNARTKALADFKANQVRILVATDIAARGLDIDQLPHVVNYELPNVEEDYVHRIGRTGRAGRSGEAISLVAPDEEKLLKAIERMTKQQIPDGDMQGFDPASVEVEKPEARGPRPERQPRADKPRHEPKREAKADGEAGDGQGKKRKRRRGKGKGAGEGQPQAQAQQPQQNQPRQARKPASPQGLPPERDPEEFLDDDFDNFGNRADYVSPNPPKAPGRNQRRGGQGQGGQARGQGAPRQGGQGGQKPAKSGQRQGGQGQGQNRGRGGQGPRGNGGMRRDEPRYERQEPVQDNRATKQPLIIRKGERLPTMEQLESLQDSRPRGEKPALLTRKNEAAE
ncbi:DEAD/DEAH box helicase [Pseudomonas subflava]|uniref:DEAD/DEAH box helicase n=1 Tax=Pseudomonas subflava TaxID=2952933 RepID=UPI00207A581A|nr:DEAD/DEAH box helicase [Pseudomonas subflava]